MTGQARETFEEKLEIGHGAPDVVFVFNKLSRAAMAPKELGKIGSALDAFFGDAAFRRDG